MIHIPLFPPAHFDPSPLDLKSLAQVPGGWHYASSGKACLYQILNQFQNIKEVALPSYLCSSLLIPLRALNIEFHFYDVDPNDLNPCLKSLQKILDKYPTIQAVVCPSLYGLPADLIQAEKLCQAKNILLVDDGAQSFGAKLEGRAVGTFGDAGFFSFSPGKSTAGHLGGFYWLKTSASAKFTRHPLQHRLKWWYFNGQRLNPQAWSWIPRLIWKIIRKLRAILEHQFPMWFDQMEDFEKTILGGILRSLDKGDFKVRQHFFQQVLELSSLWRGVRLIQSQRSTQIEPHKWVLYFDKIEIKKVLEEKLKENDVVWGEGYVPLGSKEDCPISYQIQGRVMELPMISDPSQMQALIHLVHNCLCAENESNTVLKF